MKKSLARKGTHTGGGLKRQAVNSKGQFVDSGKSQYTTIKKSELASLRRRAGADTGKSNEVRRTLKRK